MKYLIISLFFTKTLFAEEVKLVKTTNELPTELSLLYQSYQLPSTNQNIQLRLLKYSYQIDTYSPLINKEDLYFIIKSEIYKTILRNGNSVKNLITPDDLKLIYENIKKCDDPFLKWIQLSLASDARSLFNGKNYREFVLQNANGRLDTVIAKKVYKRLQILSRLFSQFNIDSSTPIKNELQTLIEHTLNNIIQNLYLIGNETRFETIPSLTDDPTKMKYFKLESSASISKTKVAKQKEKSVEDILEGEPGPVKLPIPIDENWSEDKNSPIDLKKLPKPTNDADWLQDI